MQAEILKQSYKQQLLKAGVDFHRAEQAADILTWEQLQLISEIWPEWAAAFSQTECEGLASRESMLANAQPLLSSKNSMQTASSGVRELSTWLSA